MQRYFHNFIYLMQTMLFIHSHIDSHWKAAKRVLLFEWHHWWNVSIELFAITNKFT